MWLYGLRMLHGMDLIRTVPGGLSKVARHLGKTRSAVSAWESLPEEYALDASIATGLKLRDLAPDVWLKLQNIPDFQTVNPQVRELLMQVAIRQSP